MGTYRAPTASGLAKAAEMNMLVRRIFSLTLVVAAVANCGSGDFVRQCESSVAAFHQQFDREDYASIFNGADERFRQAGPASAWIVFAQNAHHQLGAVQRTSVTSTSVNYGTDGVTVRLTYATEFEHGSRPEEFEWKRVDGEPKLLKYRLGQSSGSPVPVDSGPSKKL